MSVVVGASSRVGKAIVTRLAFAGHRVIGIDSSTPQLQNIEDEMKKVGGNVTCIPFQENEELTLAKASALIEDGAGMRGLVIAPLDKAPRGNIAESTTIQFNTVFAQRLTLPFRLIKCALPHLRKSNESSVVIVNSSSAYTPLMDLGLFSACSTALLSLSRALAIDPSVLPTRVNSVLTCAVDGDGVWNEEEMASLREMVPLGRLGSTADVGAAVEFLLSTKSRYMTGESLLLNGGMQLRL